MKNKTALCRIGLVVGVLGGLCGLTGCEIMKPAPQRACNQVARLCELSPEDAKDCSDELSKVERSLGPERMDKLSSCLKESTSCAEAGGCMAGTGVDAIGDQVNKFLKGFSRALTPPPR